MAPQLYAGKLAAFAASMAEAMEQELRALNIAAGLGDLPDTNIDDRRRLFIAIARGVIQHMKDNQGAFRITVDVTGTGLRTVAPDIQVRP